MFRPMKAWNVLIGAALVACVACGGEVETDPQVSTTIEHHPRFVGLWSFNERAVRGGFSHAVWELGSNGELTLRRKLEASGNAEILGGVRRTRDNTFCRINTSWSSHGADRLRFSTSCADGIARMVTYRFPTDPSQNAIDPDPVLEDVSGETTGWSAQDGWGFQMRKCTSVDACDGS